MRMWLIGMMGTGKSTVGRLAAARLGVDFTDTDDEIEKVSGSRIPDLWANGGETEFRAIESRAVTAASMTDGVVIATGGGAVLSDLNRVTMSSSGIVVWLQASTDVSLARIGPMASRPLIAGMDGSEGLDRIFDQRLHLYELMADHTLETDGMTVEDAVDALVALWNR